MEEVADEGVQALGPDPSSPFSVSSATLEVTGLKRISYYMWKTETDTFNRCWAGEAGPEDPCSPLLLKLMSTTHHPR